MKFFKSSSYQIIQQQPPKDLDIKGQNPFYRLSTSSDDSVFEIRHPRQKQERGSYYLSILNLLVLLISTSLFTTGAQSNYSRNAALKKTSFYSPILNRLTIPTGTKMVNGTLFPPSNPSIARLYPNPKVDAFWADFDKARTIPITAAQVHKLGKDPSTVAKFEDEYWGLGDDAYMAQIDVFHQLHCLNTLRMIAYPDYYEPGEKCNEHPEMWYVHVNHCVDILMQNIMCNANVDLYTLQWMVREWRDESAVDWDMWVDMVKPKGVKQVPAPDEYYELWGTPKPGEEGESLIHGHH